ncbi:hypothetical protein MMC08_008388 [Hypocenomyce scalaris]|nr:hypothetical protein [Hypocenomyce scalaris]
MMASVQLPQGSQPVYALPNYPGFTSATNYNTSDTAPGFATLMLNRGVQLTDYPISGFSSNPDFLSGGFIPDLSPSPISPATEAFPSPAISGPPAPTIRPECSFRKSKYEVEPEYRRAVVHQAPCETPAMKNNGASPAHFRSEDFQPEICDPGSEYRVRGKKG